MFLLKSIYNYFFPEKWSDEDKIEYLDREINLLQIQAKKENLGSSSNPPTPTHGCYERTGVITNFGDNDNVIFIDGIIVFDTSYCGLDLHINDKILYLCRKDSNDKIVVLRILKNYGSYWGEEGVEDVEETGYDLLEHMFVGEVGNREGRTVFIKDSNLKFNLDDAIATFVPIQGDWLELLCKVQFDKERPMNISLDTVVEVISFRALRSKVRSAEVTDWDGETGICSRTIFFNRQCIDTTAKLAVGLKVMIEAIESNQGTCTWRVIKMHLIEEDLPKTIPKVMPDTQHKSMEEEKNHNLDITYPLKFENVNIKDTTSIPLNITNNNNQPIILNKWIMVGKKRNSQVIIEPFLTKPTIIHPGQTFNITITCHPKFFGRSKEHLIIMFKGFQIERFIEIHVISNSVAKTGTSTIGPKTELEKVNMQMNLRQNNNGRVERCKQIKGPHFVSVRLGMFNIPEKVWNAVLGDTNETLHYIDHNQVLTRIETNLPCLKQPLNINNYTDKFHAFIYMEEIQVTVNMRSYDLPKAYLNRYQDCLGIAISGLSEKRPSLIIGDRVVVKDIYDDNAPSYEGFVQIIKGDLVLIKFNERFHKCYLGGDISIKFCFSRSLFRRAHQAINNAISNLGVDVLFPNRIKTRPPQIPIEQLETITWYNKDLNYGQKSAVRNILLGECRPMPYCIYGPPGTGKTVTVIETVLQILNNNTDSRILIATPSNSAANLIAERLLMYKEQLSSSIVRVIANYLVDSDNIPDVIKPYCATINIAREDTSLSHVVKDGMNLNVSASYVTRYRVSIGTCYALSPLAQVGLTKGHYTHIIIDEAGQALEPEIMIALSFINRESGQIILAGDPMQLGPIVMSKYCKELGYDESYMTRVLDMYPYQKDYPAFKSGFNPNLVTRLTENYRSLEEVIELPSEMFYDSSLVAKLPRHLPWVERLLTVVSDLFENTDEHKTGGIYVYGIKGRNARSEESPSWFNHEEASMIGLTMCKLYSKDVMADEIGIITPYTAQIKYLRYLLSTMRIPLPKIGTVEEFQGQERSLILLSTVRTTESEISEDLRYALGFLKNPKRLNVALTRAQVAVIIFCDPHLLCTDLMWRKVINNAIENNKYMGCDVPTYTASNKEETD